MVPYTNMIDNTNSITARAADVGINTSLSLYISLSM